MIAKGPPDSAKMKELILHVAAASTNDEKFGAVKLNKILFYADFLAYFRRGKSITGQIYFAIQDGPAPQQFLPIRKEMEAERSIVIQRLDFGMPRPMERVIALKSPPYEHLTAEDVAIVDFVIARFRTLNGSEASALSHKFKGWCAAYSQGPKTIIPYASVLFDPAGFWDIELPELPDDQIEYGRELWNKTSSA